MLNRFGEMNSHIFFNNIPKGTTYEVNEGAVPAGWSFFGFDRTNYIGSDRSSEYVGGLDYDIDYDGDKDCIGIQNTYTAPVYGALDVTKSVTGNSDVTSPVFTVKVTFTNPKTAL
jgi:hypothetical protein